MTIRPGAAWGEVVAVPDGSVDLAGDAELAAAIERGEPRPMIVRGGDLFRTAGSPVPSDTVVRVALDVLRLDADGDEITAVAHAVVRRPGPLGWWHGRILAVMNVEHIGHLDVAPRAHPNDGRFDVVDVSASLPVRVRWHAYRRLPAGSHVPHPGITTRRGKQETFVFDRPMQLWVDGVARGTVRSLGVRVIPDAAVIHV